MAAQIEHILTNQLPQLERLDFWNRIASETFCGLTVDSERETFDAEMWRWSMGDLTMIRPKSPNAVVQRNARIARSGGDRVMLHFQHAGSCLHTQANKIRHLRAGDSILTDSYEDYRVELSHDNDMLVVEMPRGALVERMPNLNDVLSSHRISGETPSSRVLHDFILSLWRQGDQSNADPAWVKGITDVFYNLLAMALTDRNLRVESDARLINRLTALVKARLCDPELRTSRLAEELGVSIRTVQNAFAAIGETPSAYILNKRLHLAADRLVAAPELSVTSVAYESGFNDCSYFTRCFKQKFGVSPTAYRAAH
ncbi:helix-turn-helix domain-containing protein [Hyphococcus sp.]|uniref:helix-turn-helix domain-containing protein n=1 Tax=Hyphococcus sp. TaxID=2038636 RepID=UPI003D147800